VTSYEYFEKYFLLAAEMARAASPDVLVGDALFLSDQFVIDVRRKVIADISPAIQSRRPKKCSVLDRCE